MISHSTKKKCRNLRCYEAYHYIIFCFKDITSLVQWWSMTDIELYLEDPKVLNLITENENAIAIMNHKYDIGKIFLTYLFFQKLRLLINLRLADCVDIGTKSEPNWGRLFNTVNV
jgi:hypothetical protein